jgi:hypothetical protein
VNPDRLSDWDRTAYMEAVEDVMEVDAVLVAASGNIDVSPCLKIPLTRDSD